jgi:methyl-accepting chemotaxis protein
MRLSDYRIKSRIYAGSGALMLITLGLAVFGYFELGTVDRQLGKYESISGNTVRNLTAQQLAEHLRRLVLRYSAYQDDSVIEQFNADQAQAQQLLVDAGKATLSEERRRLYADAGAAIASNKENFDKLVALGKKTAAARAKLFSGGDALTAATGELVKTARAQSDESVKPLAADLMEKVLLVRVANWRFLATRDPKDPATFKANLEKAEAALAALEKSAAGEALAALIAPVRKTLADYGTSFDEISDAMLASEELYDKHIRPTSQKIADDGAAAQQTLDSDLAKTHDDTNATLNRTKQMQLGLAVIGLVLGAVLAYFIGRSIVAPVAGMTTAMRKLADRDMTTEIPSRDAKDEIGEMARAVQVFKDSMIKADALAAEQKAEQARKEARQKVIEGYIADFDRTVREALDTLASAATEMRATASSMSATAEETQRQASTVASASEQTSANVQTVAASAEEMSGSISEISRQVTQAAQIAAQAVGDAQRTNATVTTLAEAAQKIGQVVQLIQDIASQTNLLALNATIEAARAGDAGKGFAVVASEVKSLANQTAKATEDIAAQIASIQSVTNDAVKAIQGIGGTIGHINEISTAIASAVEEQGAATQEIARNTQQAAKGTEQVTSNIAGVNRAAGETGAAATQVLASAEQLNQQSETLRSEVGSFLEKIRAA